MNKVNLARLKERSLELILSRLHWVQEVQKQQHNNQWLPWVKEAKKVRSSHGMGIFCGKSQESGYTVIAEFGTVGYSVHRLDSEEEKILGCFDTELPLMATDPYWERFDKIAGKELIEKRLKGEVKGYPWRQDLVDRYFFMEHRASTCFRVKDYYIQLLFRALNENYRDSIYKNHGEHVSLITIESNGHQFFIDNSRGSFRLLTESELLPIKL